MNLANPKRSKIWYVAHGAVNRRVAAPAKCESAAINIWIIFLNLRWMSEMSEPLSHAAYRKVPNLFKRSQICPKKSLGNLI